jgi:hypothetical protein
MSPTQISPPVESRERGSALRSRGVVVAVAIGAAIVLVVAPAVGVTSGAIESVLQVNEPVLSEPEVTLFADMSLADLHRLATRRGLAVSDSATRVELIEALRGGQPLMAACLDSRICVI